MISVSFRMYSKMNTLVVLAIICISRVSTTGSEKCKTSNSFSKCLADDANKRWAQYVKDYNLKSIPLENIKKEVSPLGYGTISDGVMLGCETIKFQNILVNPDIKTFDVIYYQPEINIIGQHNIKGTFLDVPIDDQGHVNYTYINGIYKYHADYEIQEKDGQEYIDIKKFNLVFHVENMIVTYDTPAGQERGEMLTRLFTDNWRTLHLFTEGVMGEIISGGYTPIIKKYLNQKSLKSLIE